jgi:lipopolysaccharide transport system ATP-binding protein
LGAGFNPEFTGRENVFLSDAILGLTESEIRERYDSIVDFAGIGDFIGQPVKFYSSGMYARLAFAVAAHVDADVLIIDEILAVGDASFTQRCMKFIRRFKERGTLLFVSHDSGSVVSLCDRALWLDGGKVREIGPAKDVCHNYLAAILAEQEDPARFKIGSSSPAAPPKIVKDPRKELLDTSQLRNTIEVFDFNPDANWFGERGGSVVDVKITDQDGNPYQVLEGGEVIDLRIAMRAEKSISSPIVGFYIKDKLGQQLFGDNTYLAYRDAPQSFVAGDTMAAIFRFQLPYLPPGDFSVTVALASGTPGDHLHHHWLEDCLFFHVATSHVHRGLLGIPMLEIHMHKTTESVLQSTVQ